MLVFLDWLLEQGSNLQALRRLTVGFCAIAGGSHLRALRKASFNHRGRSPASATATASGVRPVSLKHKTAANETTAAAMIK